MLTGYNTDVAYEGITYHVQTEDKGVANPIILSLVYRGGTILAAKRTNYQEMVNEGAVDEPRLAAMLERQHRVIIAAIQAGKIEQLAKRSQGEADSTQPSGGAASLLPKPIAKPAAPVESAPPDPPAAGDRSPGSLDLSLDQILAGYLQTEESRERLGVELLTSPRFVAGEQVTVRAAVLFDGHRPVDNATVKLQIVGTTVKPQSFASRVDRSGIVNFTVTLPQFTSGSAALILRASEPKGQEAEIKFLIRRK